jgi:ferredoxin
MRIAVSAELCSGQGRCYTVSPELFSPDDEGFVQQRGTELEVPAGLEDQARLAVASCPEGAITLTEGS